MSELLCWPAGDIGDVELQLSGPHGIGEECETLAVGRPGDIVLLMGGFSVTGGDPLGSRGSAQLCHVDGSVVRRGAAATGE